MLFNLSGIVIAHIAK